MILIPKYSEIAGEVIGPTNSIKGEYRIQRYNCMGDLNYDSGFVQNLITDFGMLSMADDPGWSSYYYIGDSATAPSVLDTAMGSFLADSNVAQGSNLYNSAPTGPLYEKWTMITRRFVAGNGIGTIKEVGIGSNTSGGELFARQLVSPWVTKAADEVVDVTWRITRYPGLGDIAGTAVFDGLTYDTITRALNVDSFIDNSGNFGQCAKYVFAGAVSDSGLVALTANSLDANKLNSTSGVSYWDGSSSYTPGTGIGWREVWCRWPLNQGNLAAGVRTWSWQHQGPQSPFQVQFIRQGGGGETIPKDETKELTLGMRVTWVRH